MAALVLLAGYVAIAFGFRTWVQWRDTGDGGFRGPSGWIGSLEWVGGVLFILALAVVAGGPVAALAGLDSLDALDFSWIHIIGMVLALTGIAVTFVAQTSMGANWRIGVDESEATELVTGGAFALVRNPILGLPPVKLTPDL